MSKTEVYFIIIVFSFLIDKVVHRNEQNYLGESSEGILWEPSPENTAEYNAAQNNTLSLSGSKL